MQQSVYRKLTWAVRWDSLTPGTSSRRWVQSALPFLHGSGRGEDRYWRGRGASIVRAGEREGERRGRRTAAAARPARSGPQTSRPGTLIARPGHWIMFQLGGLVGWGGADLELLSSLSLCRRRPPSAVLLSAGIPRSRCYLLSAVSGHFSWDSCLTKLPSRTFAPLQFMMYLFNASAYRRHYSHYRRWPAE